MTPRTQGFGIYHNVSSVEVWATLITLGFVLVIACVLALALGRRRLAEMARELRDSARA